MLKINLGKCCVLTILFLNIVTSTTINESSIVRSTYTNNTRDKRFYNHRPQAWARSNGQEYQLGFLADYHHNYQNNLNSRQNYYKERQHLTYYQPEVQQSSNYDPYIDFNNPSYPAQIPQKIYFNREPTRQAFETLQPAYIPNIYEHPHNNRIIPNHNPAHIYINLHVYHKELSSEITNNQMNPNRVTYPQPAPQSFSPNLSQDRPPNSPQNFSHTIPSSSQSLPPSFPQNVPQNIPQYNPQNIQQNFFHNMPQYRPQNLKKKNPHNFPSSNIPQNHPQYFPPNLSQNRPQSLPQSSPQYFSKNHLQNFQQNFPSLDILHNLPQNFPQIRPQTLPPSSPQYFSQNYPQSFLQNFPQNVPQNMLEYRPENIQQNAPQNMTQYRPQNFQQNVPQDFSIDIRQNFPQNFPPNLSQNRTQSLPQISPQYFPPYFRNTSNAHLETTTQSPNSDNTSPSVIDGSIDAKVFGTDVDLGNQIIGPTGSLIIQDQVSSFAIADISCDKPYTPPKMPNFQAPGRRISEARCFEYIYQLKVKDDLERRNQQCNNNSPPNADDSSRPERQVTIAVVGGQKAAPEEFAHMAAIGWLGVNEPIVFKCGGSLISPNFLLTAAHCRSSRPDTELTDLVPRMARIGGNNIGYKKSGEAFDDLRRRRQTDSAQLDVGIVNIITHEQYDPNMQYFDIALMQLAYSLDFSRKIKPACLWVDLQTSNRIRRAVASGWGVVNPNTGRTSLSLQAGELDIIDVNTCNELIRGKFGRKFNGFAEHQLCAGKLSGSVDVCQGDSGGPLQVKVKLPVSTIGNIHAIVGIISAGPDCGKPDMPGIYTRVASFIDWIEPKVWN